PDYKWTGAISTNWNTASNWLCGNIPPVGTSVQIPNVTNKPVLNSGSGASVKDLEILAGSSLTVSANTLKIAGTITNNGSFDVSSGKIELNGTVAQTIPAGLFAGNAIKDLTVNNSAGVTLGGPLNLSGILLLQSGDLVSNGNLTLASTAAGTASIDGSGTGQVTGNMTMQRFIPTSFGYKYFSSPFQSATVGEFADDVDLLDPSIAFYAYDEDREFFGFQVGPWYDYNDQANFLKPLEGYAINFGADPLPRTVDLSGTANNGPVTINLTNSNNPYSTGFNLVGNPYPSAINWSSASGWTKVNIDNALYYFKSSSTDQYTGTYSSWINGVSSDGVASAVVPSMQGFIVHVTDGTYPVAGMLGMDNRVRLNNLTQPFYAKGASLSQKSKSGDNDFRDLIRISAQYSDLPGTDAMTIYFDDQATAGFDSDFDALKLLNSDASVPSLYTTVNEQTILSITALPHSADTIQKIPLGISLQNDGEIVFSLSAVEGNYSYSRIILTDELKNEQHDLLSESGYKVSLEAGDHKGRFFIGFEKDLSTGVKNLENDRLFRVYSSHGIVYADISSGIKGQGVLSISSVSGQTFYTMKVFDNGHYEFSPGVADGIYICSFVTGGIRFSEKIYIRQQ
ncbi:MAG TPA: hypothetical protein VHO68_03220, partial [Bacteroidales bacterium]|nr:hypothetical protein [Bacteroidales bacterium]